MEPWGWAAVGTLLGTGLGAVGTLVIRLMQARFQAMMTLREAETRDRREEERTALDQWKELHALRAAQLNRLEKHIAQQDELIADLYAADAECQVQLAQLYGSMEWMHASLGRCRAALARHGEDVDPPPDLPPRPPRRDRMAEFRARQSAQVSKTLHAVTEKIREQQQSPPLTGSE